MILIINGSFGVGKTTVGRLLKKKIKGSRLYNPEWAGSVLMRLPSFIKLSGSGTDDFQDIDLWRQSVIYGTRLFRASPHNTVIVPMAFRRKDYFEEITGGMRKFDEQIKVYCLKAGMATILKRLERRGTKINSKEGEWIARKAQECISAHRDSEFGEAVNTESVTAAEVADDILMRLKYANGR
ncbi:MAG TPA: hypothetical protein VF556_09085 [Pyrinomonadaceae bacterium]|jgi:hypothetical protein